MKRLKDLVKFVQDVARDPRIPESDKKILLILVGLIVSPVDLIPDWIPIVGLLDDMLILAIVLDYFFNQLDQEILLSHYPWTMKSFLHVRRFARGVSWLAPRWITRRVWKFVPSPYGS